MGISRVKSISLYDTPPLIISWERTSRGKRGREDKDLSDFSIYSDGRQFSPFRGGRCWFSSVSRSPRRNFRRLWRRRRHYWKPEGGRKGDSIGGQAERLDTARFPRKGKNQIINFVHVLIWFVCIGCRRISIHTSFHTSFHPSIHPSIYIYIHRSGSRENSLARSTRRSSKLSKAI